MPKVTEGGIVCAKILIKQGACFCEGSSGDGIVRSPDNGSITQRRSYFCDKAPISFSNRNVSHSRSVPPAYDEHQSHTYSNLFAFVSESNHFSFFLIQGMPICPTPIWLLLRGRGWTIYHSLGHDVHTDVPDFIVLIDIHFVPNIEFWILQIRDYHSISESGISGNKSAYNHTGSGKAGK
jgi:hypothetical protein